jgi:hypothetical protein
MLRTFLYAVLYAVFGIIVAGSVSAQVSPPPQVVRLDVLTCQDALSLSAEQRTRLLIYLTGYLDGKHRATIWDERLAGERIDRAVAECKAKPQAPILQTFADAWSR